MSSEPFSLYSARQFAEKYKDARRERQLGQSFWRDFFADVCQVDPGAAGIEFEYPIRSGGVTKFADVFWPKTLLIEHKSSHKSLDEAQAQAIKYVEWLPTALKPRHIAVSNFQKIRLTSLSL